MLENSPPVFIFIFVVYLNYRFLNFRAKNLQISILDNFETRKSK